MTTITITLGGGSDLHEFSRLWVRTVRGFNPTQKGVRCLTGPYLPLPAMNVPTAVPSDAVLFISARSTRGPARDFHAPLVYEPGGRVQVPLTRPHPAGRAALARLAGLFDEQRWIFAESYRGGDAEHSYSARRSWSDDAAFVWAIEQIQTLGRGQRFHGAWWVILECGPFYYWAGYERPSDTKWVNRREVPGPSEPYDLTRRQTFTAENARLLDIPPLRDGWRGVPREFTRDPYWRFGVATFGYPSHFDPHPRLVRP